MREYGDKDSAAQMLSIRHNGQLTESREALVEDINVQAKGPIMAMKCLESGHVVTSSGSVSAGAPWNLYVWDLRDKVDQAKTPVARNPAGTKIWFDAKGTDVCSVDKVGTIYTYDLYKAVSSGKHSNTANVDFTANIDIDREFKFYSSCISINALDSTVLTGSDEHAQIARWDPRSPTVAAFTTTACLQKGTKPARINFDAVYGIEWNPNNSNEFLTVHAHTVRVWDARKMDNDTFATFHDMGRHSMSKAYWSPHRSNCIAGLNKKGQVNIWEINKFDGAANLVTPVQNPKQLFVHQGHELVVSDFAWCPYVEDVICTVAPGTKDKSGNIQVWRPRNLHDVDDNGEP
ncbi:hypothetical protein EDD11_007350 [Mortierella claussenii]|nr:hypothetical protein EDD11_007350 [Mortierella claussenii]